MKGRISHLQQKLKEKNLDALFVTDQHNITYLTAFAGLSPNEREGYLFITQKSATLLTFSTYFALYKDGGPGFDSQEITISMRISDHLKRISEARHIQRIGFERENLTIAELDSLKKKVSVEFVETSDLIEELRITKDEQEIKNLRHAAKITDDAFAYIQTKIRAGMTEKDLALELEFFMRKKTDNIAFAPIVAFNEHAAIPHHMSADGCRLKADSLILLDFGAQTKGYCADMTRVIFFGRPTQHMQKVYNTVKASQQTALDMLRPGINGKDVDIAAKKVITDAGFPSYTHGLGHGTGLAIHESPRLKENWPYILEKDMIVTVEPGIYLPGDCGVRIEDLVLLTKEGIEILSKSTKEVIIL